MRALPAVAVLFSIVLAAVLIMREPRPETAAQIGARQTAERLGRERLAPSRPPRRLETGASRRGRLAWAAIDLDAAAGAGIGRERHRQTMALLRNDDEWRVMIDHDAPVLTPEALRDWAKAGATLTPIDGGDRYRGDRRSLDKRFRRWLAHPGKARVERQAIAVGPTLEEFSVGDSAVKVLLAGWERDYGELRLQPGGTRVWVSPGGGAGWVMANVEARPPGWSGGVLGLRLTAVYRARGEDNWGLALAHLSVGASDRDSVDSGRSW